MSACLRRLASVRPVMLSLIMATLKGPDIMERRMNLKCGVEIELMIGRVCYWYLSGWIAGVEKGAP